LPVITILVHGIELGNREHIKRAPEHHSLGTTILECWIMSKREN